MKTPLIPLLLSAALISSIATSVWSKDNGFSNLQQQHIQLPSLEFQQIMQTFYRGKLIQPHIEDELIRSYPNIGLKSGDKSVEQLVALMHPIVTYKNAAAEQRFLVMIEMVNMTTQGQLDNCHACVGTADLYSFKQLSNGQFELVSRSTPDAEFAGSFGRVHVDLSKPAQALGQNLVGMMTQNGFSNTGETEQWWEALHLPENDYIQLYYVADAGGDNLGNYDEKSPSAYSYSSKMTVIKDKSAYYPIKIKYTGKKYSNDRNRVKPYNVVDTKHFNVAKNKYE